MLIPLFRYIEIAERAFVKIAKGLYLFIKSSFTNGVNDVIAPLRRNNDAASVAKVLECGFIRNGRELFSFENECF